MRTVPAPTSTASESRRSVANTRWSHSSLSGPERPSSHAAPSRLLTKLTRRCGRARSGTAYRSIRVSTSNTRSPVPPRVVGGRVDVVPQVGGLAQPEHRLGHPHHVDGLAHLVHAEHACAALDAQGGGRERARQPLALRTVERLADEVLVR